MIDEKEQTRLFDIYGTPDKVRRHCNAVTACALRLGQAFNAAGYALDLPLIEGAARVHDVARTAEHHDEVGADFLITQGYPEEAALVREHTRHPFHKLPEVDELDILCMADRVVREDEYVGIDRRVDYLLGKMTMTDDRRELLRALLGETKAYFAAIEEMIGVTFDELLGDVHAGE